MKVSTFRGALALGLVSMALGAQAIVIRSDRTDQQYRDFAQNFSSVGSVQTGQGFASGVLITPNWVLTAAHVVNNSSTNVRFNIGGSQFQAVERHVHPLFNGVTTGGFDFTLIRLNAPVLNVQPARLFLESDELGQEGALVGYGRSGTGLTGFAGAGSSNAGIKRAGTNVIDQIGGIDGFGENNLYMDFDPVGSSPNLFGSSTPTDLEAQGAPGDSGGGFFIQRGGQWRLAGIASFVLWPAGGPGVDGRYGAGTAYARVSTQREWIGEFVPEAIPEPATMTALALGAGLMALRRRRKYKA